MIAKMLLTSENVGRGVKIWEPQGTIGSTRALEGKLRAWSRDFERVFVELEKDYGRGRRIGSLVEAPRDICSFRQADTGD
jgi:hypothetical protein